MAETYSFSDFPEDVQLSVLSFLTPPEITSFACTSKQFLHLFRDESSKLWYAPLSPDEAHIYDSRIHLRPSAVAGNVLGLCPVIDNEGVTQIMHINSSYDLVIPGLVETAANPWCVEGRIWKYKNGTFGFGFLRDSFIVDVKHIAHNGCLLDAMGPCGD